MTRALLVRHGQSSWNAEGRWQGQADPPLSDLGRLQARHAAQALGALDAIVSSDLLRAHETALIISAELGMGSVRADPDLRERNAGEWQGLTRAEIDRDWPGYLDSPEGPGGAERRRPPGWEPDDALLARANAALARVHAEVPQGYVLVVTHGGVIYAVEQSLGAPHQRIANLGGRWVDLGPDGPKNLGERVVLVEPDEITLPAQL
jgi:probable phosphoglycerate mutase